DLTARITEELRALIVEGEDRETLRLVEGLEAIRRADATPPDDAVDRGGAAAIPGGAPRAARVAWVQVATRAYRWLAPRAPARVARLRGEVEGYLAAPERLG